MAAVTWPYGLAKVLLSDYTLGEAENVRRTGFDSGAVAQKQISTVPLITREFDIVVKVSHVAQFRQWVRENGVSFFNFRDWEDGVQREARIQGGRVELRHVEGDRFEGERYMTARLVLEGYPS